MGWLETKINQSTQQNTAVDSQNINQQLMWILKLLLKVKLPLIWKFVPIILKSIIWPIRKWVSCWVSTCLRFLRWAVETHTSCLRLPRNLLCKQNKTKHNRQFMFCFMYSISMPLLGIKAPVWVVFTSRSWKESHRNYHERRKFESHNMFGWQFALPAPVTES